VNLTVKTITKNTDAILGVPTGPTLLTLPAGTTVVDRIIPTTQDITIAGSEYTTLSLLAITNGEVWLVSPNLKLSGRIELTTAAVLGLESNNNLGTDNNAQLTQLEKIIGGTVNAVGLHFYLTQGTYYTGLDTTGDLHVSGTVTFAAPNALIRARSLYAEDGQGVINGRSPIILTGNLIISDDITVNNIGGLSLNTTTSIGNTIRDGKSIIVGPASSVSAGALVLGEGAYTAKGRVTINASLGTIAVAGGTGASPGDGLTIAPVVGSSSAVTLTSDTNAGTTFTAAAGTTEGAPVVLSGSGITIPADTTAGASLTVTGTVATSGLIILNDRI
jgi:hypothetical protein